MKTIYNKDVVALHEYLNCHNWEIVTAAEISKVEKAVSRDRRYCDGCGKIEWNQAWQDEDDWKEDGSALAKKHVIEILRKRNLTKDFYDYVI